MNLWPPQYMYSCLWRISGLFVVDVQKQYKQQTVLSVNNYLVMYK